MKLGSLEKAMLVIEILAANNRGLALSQLAALSGLPASSVHHILSTLRGHNYIKQDPETKKYFLGYRFLAISRSILESFDVRKITQPHIYKLSQDLGESVQIGMLADNKVMYVDKADVANRQVTILVHIGSSLPLHVSASGKVFLSGKTPEEVEKYFEARNHGEFGPREIGSLDVLLKEMERVQLQGYAIDDEESHLGLRAIAVPIKRDGKIIATISALGPVFRMPRQRLVGEMLPLLQETSASLSQDIVW